MSKLRSVAVLLAAQMVAALLAVSPAAAAGLSYTADLKLTAATLHVTGPVPRTTEFVTYLQNLGPTNTLTGDVIEDYVAPGGTVFPFDPSTYANCHVITAGKHYWCYSTVQFWVSSGRVTNLLPIKILSSHVTPGRITVTCTCDHNTRNNSAQLLIVMPGAKPTPTPAHPRPSTSKPDPARPTATASAATAPTAPPLASTPSAVPSNDVATLPEPSPVILRALTSSTPASTVEILLAASATVGLLTFAALVIVRRRRIRSDGQPDQL